MDTYADALERFPRLRQSTLAAFDRCALSAKFEREVSRDWSSHPQGRGTIFHRFAAEMLKTLLRQGERQMPTSEAIEILHETLAQRDVDKVCGICHAPAAWNPEKERVCCERGHEHGSDFVNIPFSEIKDLRWVAIKFAHENSFDIDNLVDVEQRILSSIRYPDPTTGDAVERTLTGQLDALFVLGEEAEHAIVLDWKDTWMLPAPTEVGFDGYFQQRFYAWLVMQNYPSVQRVTLRELYVRYSEAREADVWRHELDDVEAELSALAERFDKAFTEGRFPPSPGRHCTMCALPEKCPIFPAARGVGAITDQQTADRYTRELVVGKSAVKDREEALKAWISVHGPTEVSDHKGRRVLGFRERQRTSRPDKETMEAAIAAAGSDGLALDELYRTAKTTRFEEHTPVDQDDEEAEAEEAALMDALARSVAERDAA